MDEYSERPLNLVQKWPYYRSKLLAEDLVMAAEGIEVYCLNPALLLGPGDVSGGSTKAVRYFLEDRLDAAPSGTLAFVDVRDVAEPFCWFSSAGSLAGATCCRLRVPRLVSSISGSRASAESLRCVLPFRESPGSF